MGAAGRRPYHSPLRRRHSEQTRDLILEAMAAIVSAEGTTEFSVQDVADRAGVALRTVYRHFPNRQALLDGLSELVDRRLNELRADTGPAWHEARTLDDLLRAVPEVFAQLDELVPLSTALTLLSASGHRRARDHEARTAAYRRILRDHLGVVDDERATASFAVIRHLLSANTWYALREEFGLSGRRAGEAAARAVAAIVAQASRTC